MQPCTSMKTIETTLTSWQHSRKINNTTTNWRRIVIHDTRRSWPIWIYGLLWTISRTTVTTQRHLYRTNSLTEQDISQTDYAHVQRVLNHIDITNLRNYGNFYLLIDVPLLVDVSENFRTCASNIMVLILIIITFPLVFPGKLLLKWHTWNWTFSLILTNTCSLRKGSGEREWWLAINMLKSTHLTWKMLQR